MRTRALRAATRSTPAPRCTVIGLARQGEGLQKYRRRAARTDRARSRVGRAHGERAAMPLGPPTLPWHRCRLVTGAGKAPPGHRGRSSQVGFRTRFHIEEWRRSSAVSEEASLLRSRRSAGSSHTNHAAAPPRPRRRIRSNRSRRTKRATPGRGLALAECGRMTLGEYQLTRFPRRMCSIHRSNRRRANSFGPRDIPCSTTHTLHRVRTLQVRTRRHIRAPRQAA
jgi:hypothetical protein